MGRLQDRKRGSLFSCSAQLEGSHTRGEWRGWCGSRKIKTQHISANICLTRTCTIYALHNTEGGKRALTQQGEGRKSFTCWARPAGVPGGSPSAMDLLHPQAGGMSGFLTTCPQEIAQWPAGSMHNPWN